MLTDRLYPCACLGPTNGEPHCHCLMEHLGIPRSEEHKEMERRKEAAIKAALPGIFGWQINGVTNADR